MIPRLIERLLRRDTHLILLHVAVWTFISIALRTNLDRPGDMVEAYTWGQGWQFGYYKHPPLSGWLAGAWFSIAPRTDESFALLAALTVAIGLAGFIRLARLMVPAPWATVALLVAMLSPQITTMALRFNANSVLIATWPWIAYHYVRMLNDGRARDALLCGLWCALGVLGKYFTLVWLASIAAATLMHPGWRALLFARWRDRRVLMLVAATVFALLPHLVWLFQNDFLPLHYASHAGGESARRTTRRITAFVIGQFFMPASGLIFACWSVFPDWKWLRPRNWWYSIRTVLDPLRRDWPWLLTFIPVWVTAIAAAMTGARVTVVWTLPLAFSLALLVASRLAASGLDAPRRTRMISAWLVCCLIALVIAPTLWIRAARKEAPRVSEPRRELALEVDRMWQQRFHRPMPAVGGSNRIGESVAFYAPSRPRFWGAQDLAVQTPWISADEIRRSGTVIVCELEDAACQQHPFTQGVVRDELEVAKEARGHRFPAKRYYAWLVAPQEPPFR